MEQIGCTTRGHSNKDNICRNQEDAKKADELFRSNFIYNGSCLSPCKFVSTFAMLTHVSYLPSNEGWMILRFEKDITVFKSQYSYSTLSLVAEIGGYVGLFLGVSVLQITDIITYLFRKCCPASDI